MPTTYTPDEIDRISPRAESRFWGKVAYPDGLRGCWLYTGTAGTHGYGLHGVGRRQMQAHRFSYAIENGPIPADAFVCHSCDQRRCVNPEHLFLGTNAENMADMRAKRRGTNALTPLVERDVVRAYRRGTESMRKIGARFGISPSLVHKLVHLPVYAEV